MDVDRRAQADIFDEKTIPAIAEVERIAKVSAVKGNADHNELSADLKQGEETGVILIWGAGITRYPLPCMHLKSPSSSQKTGKWTP